jgi:hypothetical protein
VEAEQPRPWKASGGVPGEAGQVAAGERSTRQTCREEWAQQCPGRGGCPQAASGGERRSGGQPSV